MKKLYRNAIKLCLITAGCIATARFCRMQTDGFAVYKISSELSYNPSWQTRDLSSSEKEQIQAVLSQPFTYLGKGAQCFAFVSKDQKYVIKFFKQHNLRVPYLYQMLPLPVDLKQFLEEKKQQKDKELDTDFVSYRLAYDLLKSETGLVFVHLNKTHDLHITLELFDKIGCQHHLNLDEMEFLVQKKADLFYEALDTMIRAGEKEAVKERLTELVTLLMERSMKGLYDKDPDINTNFGISEGKTVQIDVGRFRPDETRKDKEIALQDIARATDNLRQWLEEQDEELSFHLDSAIQQLRM